MILIVEDNIDYAIAAYGMATSKLADRLWVCRSVHLVHTMAAAMDFITKHGDEIEVVYTDMCIPEKTNQGRYEDDFEGEVSLFLPPEAVDSAGEEETSDNLKEEIIKASIPYAGFAHAFGAFGDNAEEVVRNANLQIRKDGSVTDEQPALGYFIIKKCQEMGIPYLAQTSLGHGGHVLPALLAAGAISEEEALEAKKYYKEFGEGCIKVDNALITRGKKDADFYWQLFSDLN